MSYILEALKKAQAERQLGNAPTLNAVPVGAPTQGQAGAPRWPAWVALAAVGVAAALAVMAWRAQAPVARPAAPVPVVVTPVMPTVVAVTAPPLAVVPPSSPPPKPVAARAAPPAPVPAHAAQPAPVTAHAAPPAPAPAPVAEEEKLPALRELPEAIQRTVPPISFGGYMYSKNPADRLLLIDKTLRHEGEEVAPGLVLEKLLPKAAVMNFKGYRYRVPY